MSPTNVRRWVIEVSAVCSTRELSRDARGKQCAVESRQRWPVTIAGRQEFGFGARLTREGEVSSTC